MIDKLYEVKEYLLSKKYLIIILILVLLLIGISTYFIINYNKNEKGNLDLVTDTLDIKEELEKTEEDTCMVDIKGYVENIGLYELDCNLRVNDVIKMAGGLKENSDTSVINLGKKIFDGMVIVIYSKDEVLDFTKVKENESIIEDKCKTNSIVTNDSCITKEDRIETNITITTKDNNDTNTNKENNTKIISINTATKEELMTLSGIGESKALAIISYREENGLFNSIEEIKNVSGIGEKMFEKIKDFISL